MHAMLDARAAHPRSHAAVARARHAEHSRRVVTFALRDRSRRLLDASTGDAFRRSARFRLAGRGDRRGVLHERDGLPRPRAARASASADASAEESPSRPPLRVLFAAGGTGGHVFPAVAVADALVAASNRNALPDDREAHVSFAGTAGRQEARLVPAAGYELHVVPAVSLARPLSSPANVVKNLFALPFRLAWCLWKAFALLAKLRPHVVVGTGGYVSLPVCFAAALRKIPMCVQEQNAHPGMANRVLAPLADRVFVAFRAAADALLRAKTHRIHGNPVRKSLRSITRADARRKARFWFSMACGGGYKGQLRDGEKNDENDVVLLILGGSLGASAINRAAARAIPELLATHDNLWVVWQTGADGYERSVAAVAEKMPRGPDVKCAVDGRACKFPRLSVVPFIDEMDAAYGASDLVVARAGAITCAELVATATPAILVPSPNVAEDHQTKNARALSQAGCAAVVPERDLFVDGSPSGESGDTEPAEPAGGASTLTRFVSDLLRDPERLRAMAAAAAAADTPRAAEEIAEDIARVATR